MEKMREKVPHTFNCSTPKAGSVEDMSTVKKQKPGRLLSLDALRGFDMFWIIGGGRLIGPLFAITGWSFLHSFEKQMRHCRWDGFHAIDLVFPLFIFLSGVTLGLSRKPFWELDWSLRKKKYLHAVWRLFLLILLGVIYNRAHKWGDFLGWDHPRYASVLGRIAIAWFFCAMIVWHFRLRWQIVFAVGILLGYWALLKICGGGSTANVWMDQHFLPGFRWGGKMDPEGLLSNIPAVVSALLGAFAGQWLRSDTKLLKKVAILAGAGAVLLAIGWLCNGVMPVNKRLWSSSYVMVAGGWSCLLLALFYLVIDGWKLKWIGWPLAVIGANAIFIYFTFAIVDWRYTSGHIFGGFIEWAPNLWQPLLLNLGVIVLEWMLLAWLYRKRIFIRI